MLASKSPTRHAHGRSGSGSKETSLSAEKFPLATTAQRDSGKEEGDGAAGAFQGRTGTQACVRLKMYNTCTVFTVEHEKEL